MQLLKHFLATPRRRRVGMAFLTVLAAFALLGWAPIPLTLSRLKVNDASQVREAAVVSRPASVHPNMPPPIRLDLSDGERNSLLRLLAPPGRASITIPHAMHVLRVHGLRARFDNTDFPNSQSLLTLITDQETAASVFGSRGVHETPYGIQCVGPERRTRASQSHRDHILASLGELGISACETVTIDNRQFPLRLLLEDSLANFYLNQRELAWTALAYALYLPPRKEWRNRFGHSFTFDDLCRELMRRELCASSCGGLHQLQSLTVLLRVDSTFSLLSSATRSEVHEYLRRAFDVVVQAQHSDGSWSLDWNAALGVPYRDWYPEDSRLSRLLATGHISEWLLYLPSDFTIPETTLMRCAGWLRIQLSCATTAEAQAHFCELAHGAIYLLMLSGGM